MSKNLPSLLATLAAMFLLAGCGTARRGEPFTGPLPVNNDPELSRGQVVFQRNCHQCHPGGEGGLGPALNNKPAPAWLMKTQVRLGLGAMPAFSKEQIPPDELDALMEYLLALRHHKPKSI